MNDAHPQMDAEPVIDTADAEPEPRTLFMICLPFVVLQMPQLV
jgi:hypothetical protein